MYRIDTEECSMAQPCAPDIHRAVLHDALLGRLEPALALPSPEGLPFQILLLRSCGRDQAVDADAIAKMLHTAKQWEHTLDILSIGHDRVVLLWGAAAIRKLEEPVARWQQEDNPVNHAVHLVDPLFIACGPVCDNIQVLPQAYQDTLALMEHCFFCGPKQQLLLWENRRDRSSLPPAINILLLEKYTARLMQSIQAFNRPLTASVLAELADILSDGCDTPEDIRLFFIDLYLQLKEQMKYLYQGHTIPFYTNTHIIKTIMQAPRLHDITCFLVQRFDMIMSSIGASSQESVLDSILHYIHHNFTSNITLESIAPLFGYNHSYLGKIFRKKMGVSFNEYVDRLRVERAKNLLLQDNSKVYTVSKLVGYKNVDYFHVKFRKYVNMSPVEFRRANSADPIEDPSPAQP